MKKNDAASLYDAACYRSVVARLAKDKLEADKAIACLKKAVAAGYRNREHLDQDPDLDALRERADFKELVASLPYLAPPPRVVR